jgi:quercetin dioxygenase-like cupin family protein
MTYIASATAPTYTLPGLAVTGLAAPSRGATETCAWRLTLEPGHDGVAHEVDREEIFVALRGTAAATVEGVTHTVGAGDALIVPAKTVFTLANPYGEPFEAVAVLPVGGLARFPGGEPFPPPWTT